MKNWYNHLSTRYASFSEDVQILNMVSDLEKAKNLSFVDSKTAVNHLYRALILLDYMADDPKWKMKLRELLRLREAVASLIAPETSYGNIEQIIEAALQMVPKAYRLLHNIQTG
jgi:hypothetical protein